jgi:hypothetical protein
MTKPVRIAFWIFSFIFPVTWMAMPALAGVKLHPVDTNYSCQLRVQSAGPHVAGSSVSYFIDTFRVANTTDYRLDMGDGGVFENNSGNFVYSYASAGTYNPRAYIKDVNAGEWHRCQHSSSIQIQQSDSRILGITDPTPVPTAFPTATPAPVQPATGGQSWVTVGLVLVALVGVVLLLSARLRRR